jgi:hypothetical protein
MGIGESQRCDNLICSLFFDAVSGTNYRQHVERKDYQLIMKCKEHGGSVHGLFAGTISALTLRD